MQEGMQVSKEPASPEDPTEKRVTLWDTRGSRKLSGNAAPMEKNLNEYLLRHPECEVWRGQKRHASSWIPPQVRVAVWNKQERRKVSGNAAPLEKNIDQYLLDHTDYELYNGQDVRRPNKMQKTLQDPSPSSPPPQQMSNSHVATKGVLKLQAKPKGTQQHKPQPQQNPHPYQTHGAWNPIPPQNTTRNPRRAYPAGTAQFTASARRSSKQVIDVDAIADTQAPRPLQQKPAASPHGAEQNKIKTTLKRPQRPSTPIGASNEHFGAIAAWGTKIIGAGECRCHVKMSQSPAIWTEAIEQGNSDLMDPLELSEFCQSINLQAFNVPKSLRCTVCVQFSQNERKAIMQSTHQKEMWRNTLGIHPEAAYKYRPPPVEWNQNLLLMTLGAVPYSDSGSSKAIDEELKVAKDDEIVAISSEEELIECVDQELCLNQQAADDDDDNDTSNKL